MNKGTFLKVLLFFIFQITSIANASPTPFPIFLQLGFSTILEFEENPTQVVLGDQNFFQVERLGKSIVIKPLVPYATTNMFVYFKSKETRLFLLKASEESEPTYYKKFQTFLPKMNERPKVSTPLKYKRGLHIKGTELDKKKDYLTVDFVIAADSSGKIVPDWDLVRLKYKDRALSPTKMWSERREAQRDSYLKVRLIFAKPNVPADLKNVSLIVPIKGLATSWTATLKESKR